MDPQEAQEIARGIERIADDLLGAQRRFGAHAAPPATGSDEVSIAVASTVEQMGRHQQRAGDTATADLRRLADAVFAHVRAVQRSDTELAGAVGLAV
ncbi:PE domain-containing protein [Tsukamurella serpentis]